MATVATIAPVPLYDSFSRAADTTSGHERWGTTDTGALWRNTKDSKFNITYDMSDVTNLLGEGTISIKAGDRYSTAWVSFDSAGLPLMGTSGEVLACISWTCASSISNPDTDIGLVLDRTDDNTFYYCAIHDSVGEISIGAYIDGRRVELNRRTKSLQKDKRYWVRFQRDEAKLYVKIFDFSENAGIYEPNAWTMGADTYPGSGKPTSGTAGVFFNGGSNDYTYNVDSFYYYSKDSSLDDEPPKPVNDEFDRSVNRGWGKANTGHTWRGHISDDTRARTHIGYVTGGSARARITNTGNYWGFLGPDTTSDIEVNSTFQMNTNNTSNKVYMYFGLHGQLQITNGLVEGTGYACRVTSGGNVLGIYKTTTFSGGWSLIAQTTLGFSLASNTDYKIKFQKTGTTLRACCWLGSGTMPSAWDVSTTDSSITGGGSLFVQFTQDADANRINSWDRITYGPLTPLTGGSAITTQTTTGTLGLTSADTSITYTANYTNDSNNNNTAAIAYKKLTGSTWTSVTPPAPNTGSSPKKYTDTITGLSRDTDYQVRVTFSDSNDVEGTNPRIANIKTTSQGSKLDVLTPMSVGTSSAEFVATYLYDSNNNATANIQRRAFGTYSEFFKHDFYLAAHELAGQTGTNSSDTFTKHMASSTNAEIWANQGRAYMVSTGSFPDNYRADYIANFTGQSQMTISAQVLFPTWADGRTGFWARFDPSTKTGYQVVFSWSAVDEAIISLVRWSSGTIITGWNSDPIPIELNTFYDLEFTMADVSGDNVKNVYFDNKLVITTTDNVLTTPHKVGIFFENNHASVANLNNLNSPQMRDFRVSGRPSSGSWNSAVAMTAYAAGAGPFPANTHRYFYYNDVSLTPDTFYEFRVTIADANGTSGETQNTTTILTHGNKAYLTAGESITAKTFATSVTLNVNYMGDSDDDSSIVVQYRPISEQAYTTVPSSFVTVNRSTNTFRTVMSGLKPSTTYQVKVTLSDPDGIEDGQASEDYATFTTETLFREHDEPKKQYQWKVYDNVTGKYIETWNDAGSPKFTFDENSGVSDLTVRLPRAVSTLNDTNNNSISHQNIVDVWVHDVYENGLGPNLLEDEDFTLGKWTFVGGQVVDHFEYHSTQGVTGDRCIKITAASSNVYEALSEEIYVDPVEGVTNNAPDLYKNRQDFRRRNFVCSVYAKANSGAGGRLVLGVFEYGDDGTGSENILAFSDITGETVGNEWQKLQIPFTITNKDTKYIRLSVKNDGDGTYWVDKGKVLVKEQLLYSGHIETITSNIDAGQEYIEVEIYGEASVLSDDYIELLQFVEREQEKDRVYGTDGNPLLDDLGVPIEKLKFGATDPSYMMKYAIDLAQLQNPKCRLYYTENSIHNTGVVDAQYTFRERRLRDIFDQIRELCPSGWHYLIMPDGLVILRGPEHVKTHVLRVGVEVTQYKRTHTIKDLKNVIYFKGRQDEDFSESDGYGSITAIEFDQKSIDKYGRRVLFTQDASIVDPKTANIYVEGRLEEVNSPENQISCTVVDEKAVVDNNLGFRGYNIESILPGDYVMLLNPRAAANATYWNQAEWDEDFWDYTSAEVLTEESVPIKSITYDDINLNLELSQRPPSFTADFQKLSRKSQQNDSEK